MNDTLRHNVITLFEELEWSYIKLIIEKVLWKKKTQKPIQKQLRIHRHENIILVIVRRDCDL